MSALGAYVRRRREDRKLTQTEVARRYGIPQTYLSNIELGRTVLPSADYRRRLCRALGVSHIDLLIAAGELTAGEVAVGAERSDVQQARGQQERQAYALIAKVGSLDPRTLELVSALADADRKTLRQLENLPSIAMEAVL